MFAGFTDEDITNDTHKKPATKTVRMNGNSKRATSGNKSFQKNQPKMHSIPEGALFSAPPNNNTRSPPTKDPDLIPKMTSSKQEQQLEVKKVLPVVQEEDLINEEEEHQEGEEVEIKGTKSFASKLEGMQETQKKMEEANKKKKELLAKAIAERRQKTSQESEKLQQVHSELLKVDALITNDVTHLRQCIEEASLKFMEAQKRYEKAEKEFVASKIQLHECEERKELLVEHLCHIIQKNEERKADKLTNLMRELNIDISN